MEPTNSNDKAIRGNPRTHSTTNRRTQHLPRPKRDRSPSMGPPPKSVPITPPPATPSETIPHDGRQNYLFPRPGFASPQQKAASRRNDEQLDAAVIISKYLLARPNSFITATITGPDDHFTPPVANGSYQGRRQCMRQPRTTQLCSRRASSTWNGSFRTTIPQRSTTDRSSDPSHNCNKS
jgi:hypothetical protein